MNDPKVVKVGLATESDSALAGITTVMSHRHSIELAIRALRKENPETAPTDSEVVEYLERRIVVLSTYLDAFEAVDKAEVLRDLFLIVELWKDGESFEFERRRVTAILRTCELLDVRNRVREKISKIFPEGLECLAPDVIRMAELLADDKKLPIKTAAKLVSEASTGDSDADKKAASALRSKFKRAEKTGKVVVPDRESKGVR